MHSSRTYNAVNVTVAIFGGRNLPTPKPNPANREMYNILYILYFSHTYIIQRFTCTPNKCILFEYRLQVRRSTSDQVVYRRYQLIAQQPC